MAKNPIGRATTDLILDDEQWQRSTKAVIVTMDKVGARMEAMAGRARTVFALSSAAIGGFLKLASDASETSSKFDAVFKNNAAVVRAWATDYARAVGRSRFELEGFLATLQDTFVPLGFARQDASELSKSLLKLAVDLGSFNNEADSDVLQSLQSAIVGNVEAVRKYGIVITQSRLNQQLMNDGVVGGVKAASELEKALARYRLIVASTTDAQGDAIRTAGSFANQTKALRSEIEELAVEIGNALVPAASGYVESLRDGLPDVIEWTKENKAAVQANAEMVLALSGLVAVSPQLIRGLQGIASGMISMHNAARAGTAVIGVGGLAGALAAVVATGAVLWMRDAREAALQMAAALKEAEQATNDLQTADANLAASTGVQDTLDARIQQFRALSRLAESLGDQVESFGGSFVSQLINGDTDPEGFQNLVSQRGDVLTRQIPAARAALQQAIEDQVKALADAQNQALAGLNAGSGGFDQSRIDGLREFLNTTNELRTTLTALASDPATREFLSGNIEDTISGLADQVKSITSELAAVADGIDKISEAQQRSNEFLDDYLGKQDAADKALGQRIDDIQEFEDTLRLVGVTDEERQRILLERQREELLRRAKELGLGVDKAADINARINRELQEIGSGRDADSGGGFGFVGLTQAFEGLQTSLLNNSDPVLRTADASERTAKATEDSKDKLSEIAGSNDEVVEKLDNITGLPAVVG